MWHFCSKVNIDTLEKLQYRALRIVFNDFTSSYESLLDKVKLPTLHLSRLKTIAIETFKCLHNISHEYIQNLAKFKTSVYNCRYDNILKVPAVRTTRYGQNSFRLEAARVWNSLPNDIRRVENFKEFGRLISTWTDAKCKCNCSICRL